MNNKAILNEISYVKEPALFNSNSQKLIDEVKKYIDEVASLKRLLVLLMDTINKIEKDIMYKDLEGI